MKLKTAFATLVATMYMASFGVVGATGTLSDTVLSQYGASGIAGNSLKGSGSDWVSQLLNMVKGGASAKDIGSTSATDNKTSSASDNKGTTDKKERPNHLELVMVIDQSGSMSGLEDDTIGGFNSMISKQKKDDVDANVTAVVFSDNAKTIYDRERLGNVREMTDKEYTPGGMTALMDAIGTTITKVEKYDGINEKNNKVLFVIITDGQENDSKEWSAAPAVSKVECMESNGIPISSVRTGKLADKREPKVVPPRWSARLTKVWTGILASSAKAVITATASASPA